MTELRSCVLLVTGLGFDALGGIPEAESAPTSSHPTRPALDFEKSIVELILIKAAGHFGRDRGMYVYIYIHFLQVALFVRAKCDWYAIQILHEQGKYIFLV